MSAAVPIEQASSRQYARQLYLTTVADQFALAEEVVRKKQSHLSIWRRCWRPR